MLTIFAVPRAFEGLTAIRQRNALQSWIRLPETEVLLFGDDRGIADAAREFGARHFPSVARNEFGTPLLDSVFEAAETAARGSLLAYVNADIILFPDFVRAAKSVDWPRFLMAGTRWDVNLDEPITFDDSWQSRVMDAVRETGALQAPVGSDYFVFPGGTLSPLPPFAVGRPAWDNWMISSARNRKIRVINATQSVTAVHPRHDHKHVHGRRGNLWEGPEGDRNLGFVDRPDERYTLWDSTHLLTPNGLQRAKGRQYQKARLIRSKAFRALRWIVHSIRRLFT